MRDIIAVFALITLILLVSIIFSMWWWIMLFPLAFGLLIPNQLRKSFTLSFIAGAITWGGYAVYQFLSGSQIITSRMADLFTLPSSSALIAIIALIGGICAGFASVSGSAIRKFFIKDRQKIDYY